MANKPLFDGINNKLQQFTLEMKFQNKPVSKTLEMKTKFRKMILASLIIIGMLILIGFLAKLDKWILWLIVSYGVIIIGGMASFYKPNAKLTEQYYNIVKSGESRISAISEYVGLDYNTVNAHIREMIANGIFKNARVTSDGMIVFTPEAIINQTVAGSNMIVCKGCGAKNNTTNRECEYCGAPL